MMTFSFKSLLAPAGLSKDGNRSRSAHSIHRWFVRAGKASALAACLLAAPPWCAWADEPIPEVPITIAVPTESSVEQLVDLLSSQAASERKTAVEKLGRLGTAARPAVPELLKALSDHDPLVRASAARAVWDIDQRSAEAVPVLVNLLGSQSQDERELAAYFLGPMGAAAKPAAPALRQMMGENDVLLRIHAAEALTQIEPAESAPVDVLLEAMQHSDAEVRSLAAMAISNVAPIHAEKVVPILTSALVDSDSGVRASVEVALPNFNLDVAHSGQAFPAKEGLGSATSSDTTWPTEGNTSPFAQASPMSNELAQAVGELSSADALARKSALERIGWMGQNAKPALAHVSACLKDSDPEVRAYAAKTLCEVDPASTALAVGTLQEMLDSTVPGVRPLAAFYLGYIGPEARAALPTMKRALANSESTEQLQIAEAVARINPEDRDAVTVLIGGLRDPDSQVRFQAAYALGEVSPVHAQAVVPELATAMKDQSEQVRQAAELALASFAPAKKGVPAMNASIQTVKEPASSPVDELVASPVDELVAAPVDELAASPEEPAVEMPVQEIAETVVAPEPIGTASISQPPENKLGLGDDYRPIYDLNVSIAPQLRDEEGKLLQLPTNYGAAWLQEVGSLHQPIGESRPWALQSVQYAASGFVHRPLYFEEINLERYGHNFGPCIQPFVSAGAFFGRAPLLPYMMVADPPHDYQYSLGYYRPGDCVPFRHQHLPWSTKGALVQAGLVTGGFFAIY